MSKLFQQCKRHTCRRIDERNTRIVPATAVDTSAFPTDLVKASDGETPEPHLFDDAVCDASQHSLDHSATLLGIQQRERHLAAKRPIRFPQPAPSLLPVAEHVVRLHLDTCQAHHEVALLPRQRAFVSTRIQRASRDEVRLDLLFGQGAVSNQVVKD